MQRPDVCEPAGQGLVAALQIVPDSATAPALHVAVAEPEKPDAVLKTEDDPPCARAPTVKLHDPPMTDVAAHPSGTQLAAP